MPLIDYHIIWLCYIDNWSVKAIRRKTTGTGRMRYLRHLPRRFKSGFREGTNIILNFYFLIEVLLIYFVIFIYFGGRFFEKVLLIDSPAVIRIFVDLKLVLPLSFLGFNFGLGPVHLIFLSKLPKIQYSFLQIDLCYIYAYENFT